MKASDIQFGQGCRRVQGEGSPLRVGKVTKAGTLVLRSINEQASIMTRQSPAVVRTAAVIDFFAERPLQAFTLTDVARAVKLSAATCHMLLATLVECGYLRRNDDKTYSIGPRLVRLGRTVSEYYSPLAIARPLMLALADQYDAVCTATDWDGDVLITRERVASPSHVGWRLTGEWRRPLRYPVGISVMIWESEAEIEAWLKTASPPLDRTEVDAVMERLPTIRPTGYCVSFADLDAQDREKALTLRFVRERTTYLLSDFNPDETYEPAFIAAPVLDARGKVEFVIALVDFRNSLSGREIHAAGLRIRSICDHITEYMVHPPSTGDVV